MTAVFLATPPTSPAVTVLLLIAAVVGFAALLVASIPTDARLARRAGIALGVLLLIAAVAQHVPPQTLNIFMPCDGWWSCVVFW